MESQLKQLRQNALDEFSQVSDIGRLAELRVKYLGKKGSLTAALRGMGSLSPEERPKIGQIVNDIRNELEQFLSQKNDQLKQEEMERRLSSEQIDITLPGRKIYRGHKHPLTLTMERVKETFMRMGFTVSEGPEVETDYYNFEALNLPKDHPARDMQDSFYITEDLLLRTHTSPNQVRTMEAAGRNNPVRVIVPGKV